MGVQRNYNGSPSWRLRSRPPASQHVPFPKGVIHHDATQSISRRTHREEPAVGRNPEEAARDPHSDGARGDRQMGPTVLHTSAARMLWALARSRTTSPCGFTRVSCSTIRRRCWSTPKKKRPRPCANGASPRKSKSAARVVKAYILEAIENEKQGKAIKPDREQARGRAAGAKGCAGKEIEGQEGLRSANKRQAAGVSPNTSPWPSKPRRRPQGSRRSCPRSRPVSA